MSIDAKFWKGKRVMVTGHTGFKGSWLTFWLSQLGADVHGIALPPATNPNSFEAMQIESKCRHNTLDIRDRERLKITVKDINPEIVFHMAAQPLVRESYREPMETYETNVIGTGNVLWSLLPCPALRSVVVITTDKCYENREWNWGYRESDALGGHDPYSSSKACSEIITASFRKSFFTTRKEVGLATARAGNVIGGGDWSPDRLIPDMVRAMQKNEGLEIRYSEAIRPWQHVLVPLSGYLSLAERLWTQPEKYSEAYNFAPSDDDCVPVRMILEKFGSAWGRPMKWFQTSSKHVHEAHFLKLDSSKARATLNWQPKWDLDQALSASALWYRSFYENPTSVADLTKKQIEEFVEL